MFSGARTELTAIAIGIDAGVIAAVGLDGTLQLWDLETHRSLVPPLPATFGGDGADIAVSGSTIFISGAVSPISASFSTNRDGSELSSLGSGAVMAWDLSASNLMSHMCRLAGRNLSLDEWTEYMPDRPYQLTCPEYGPGTAGPTQAVAPQVSTTPTPEPLALPLPPSALPPTPEPTPIPG